MRTAEGEGTAVEVYLPLATVGESPESEPPEVRSTDGRARVLVVDDEEAIREVASEMLEELGCRAVAVSGGREAVERYGEDPDSIDLVLLDLVMPDLSGKETYAALREIDPGVRVVLSSGYAFGSESEALMQAGARGFLQKPYQIADLGAVVRAALE